MADHLKLVHSSDGGSLPTQSVSPTRALMMLQGGLENDGKAFARAYHAAMIATAERELIEARWLAEHHLSPVGHYSPLWEERKPAFEKMLQAVAELALIPASNRLQLSMKKRAIGRTWLTAEGQLFDQFRERVALDEEALAANSPRKRKQEG